MSHIETRSIHAGEPRQKPHHALVNPIYQTSTFTFDDTDDLIAFQEARAQGEDDGRVEYGRYGNPTTAVVAEKLASLEGGEAAMVFSTGMSAVTVTLLALLSSGDHVVMTDDCYRRTREFVTRFLHRYGVDMTSVPAGDYNALEAAIRPETRILLAESPTNPYLRVVDLPQLVEIAHRKRVHTLIDSTFATPINLRPLEHGVDLVMHSATKYLGGHNDLLAGVLIGSQTLMERVRTTQNLIGAVCDPGVASLLLRGLKTLSLRVAKHNENGQRLAAFLDQDERVARVYYPGLTTHPDHHVARRLMAGYGGVVSFELAADLAVTRRFIDALQIPYIGPSLGGAESLVIPVVLASYYQYTPDERAAIGIPDTLIRYAAGLEAVDDLIADLSLALDIAFDA